MRVITAVWLSIRPELRDEWLAGGDIDALVEESVPREQAVRGLVHWWHLRKYWDVVGPPGGLEGMGDDELEGIKLDRQETVFEDEDGEEDEVKVKEGDDSEESKPKLKGKARSKEERRKWLEEENDFFRRELERMEWNWGTGEEGVDEADQQQAQRAAGQVWDTGTQTEAW